MDIEDSTNNKIRKKFIESYKYKFKNKRNKQTKNPTS